MLKPSLTILLNEAYTGVQKVIEIGGKQLRIHIKPGIPDGQVLRMPGKGSAGSKGAENGDLLSDYQSSTPPKMGAKGERSFMHDPTY
jgi:curved DNA-binding protein